MPQYLRHQRIAVLLIVLMAFMVSACQTQSTYQKSYKSLSGSKVTVETLYTTAKQLHASGSLTDEQLAKADEAYDAAQAVQHELVDAQIAVLRSSGDPSAQSQVASISVAYLRAATNFINLAIEFGLIKGNDPAIQTD